MWSSHPPFTLGVFSFQHFTGFSVYLQFPCVPGHILSVADSRCRTGWLSAQACTPFPPSRYRCATDIVKVERISQFLFDLVQYLALFRTGRIPIRVGRREAGKGCWGHLWLQSSCI